MHHVRQSLFAALVLTALAGCSDTPLDIPRDDWARLSPAQQTMALEKQAEIDTMKADFGVQAQQEAALSAISESTRQVRVAHRRALGREGDILECVIDSARGNFSPARTAAPRSLSDALDPNPWTAVQPKAFTIVRGDSQPIHLRNMDNDHQITLYGDYADSGRILRLCSLPPAGPGVPAPARTCATVAALFNDLVNGIQRHIAVPGHLTGTLHCAFSPGPPVRVIDVENNLEMRATSKPKTPSLKAPLPTVIIDGATTP